MRHWIQITSARGPAECGWTVLRVLRCFVQEAEAAKLSVEVLETIPAPMPQTLYSALVAVEGANADSFLKSWEGTVLWIGRSPFRPNHKRKNWFVGIGVLKAPERLRWSERDLKFETMRASGPGGQHVNKTESAVRVTHIPSGLTATAREERSQNANRKLALARLAEAFAGIEQVCQRDAAQQRWSQHNTLERGNPVRVYEGLEFKQR